MVYGKNEAARSQREYQSDSSANVRFGREEQAKNKDRLKAAIRHHIEWRYDCTAKWFAIFHQLFKRGIVNQNDVISDCGARYQLWPSHEIGMQAAHAMHCQVVINGRLPDTISKNQSYQMEIKRIFGRVTHQLETVNRVDTFVDHHRGGVENFLKAHEPIQRGTSLRQVFQQYHEGYLQCLQRAEQWYANDAAVTGVHIDDVDAMTINKRRPSLDRQMVGGKCLEVIDLIEAATRFAYKLTLAHGHLEENGPYQSRMDDEGWLTGVDRKSSGLGQ
jgi:hypothetical protein